MKEALSTREAADVLDLNPSRVRALVRAGIVHPSRGPRGAYRFDFRDLVLLRVASGLAGAGIPTRRIVRVLSGLRARLPRDRSLTELRIAADGDRVLVHDGAGPWEAETGQFVLEFRTADLAARVEPLRRARLDAEAWFAAALDLEDHDPVRAREAYLEVLQRVPAHADALVNLGRLMHESGDAEAAAEHYQRALEANPQHATAAFNLGVALEDLELWVEAARAYERAVSIHPGFADAYFNLAAVRERLNDPQAALRALRRYRQLVG